MKGFSPFGLARLSQPSVAGLEISGRHIRVVELLRGNGGLRLRRFGARHAAIRPDGAPDAESLRDMLAALSKKGGIRAVHASLHFPEENAAIEMIRAAGIKPLSVESSDASLARALGAPGDSETYLLAVIREEDTGLAVVRGGHVLSASSARFGAADLFHVACEALGGSREDAEAVVRRHGLSGRAASEKLAPALLSRLALLRDEIDRHFLSWHAHPDATGASRPRIAAIMLSGATAAIPGLREYLASSLRMDVVVGNPWQNVNTLEEYVPEMTFEESLDFAAAIGAALKGFEHR